MDSIEHQVKRARRQLLLGAWLQSLGACLALGAAGFVLVTATARVGGFDWPLSWAGVVLLGGSVVVSVAWSWAKAVDTPRAAVALDEAAGLKERISTGLYCRDSEDPFCRAVRQDAARAATGLKVGVHLPVRWPDSMTFGSGAVLLSLLVFWLLPTMDLFGRQERAGREETARRQEDVQRQAVLKQVAKLKRLKQESPLLKDDREFDADLDVQAAELETPLSARRELVKKLENLAEAVRQKTEQGKYNSLKEMKKMLRRLQDPQRKSSAVSKVADALSRGNFQQARKELEKLQDELAKHELEGNREQVERLQKQLDALGKRLEKLATDSKKLEDTLKQAGIKSEDAKRMLENLSRKDFSAVRKQLQDANLSAEQIEKLLKKLKDRRLAETMAKNLGAALQMAAGQSAGSESGGDSAAGMQAAAEALSQAEQLAQELAELESTMSQLADMKGQAGCSQCQGAGCASCGGGDQQGPGMGRRGGRGRGGLASEAETGVGFKKVRSPVRTTQGSVIGSFLIKGSQFKRESAAEFSEVFISAEKDLSQAIARDKIPPYARKTVKEYFSRGTRRTADERSAESPQDTDQ
jgi:hypothetical protein